jgi:hypothetical protein
MLWVNPTKVEDSEKIDRQRACPKYTKVRHFWWRRTQCSQLMHTADAPDGERGRARAW